MERMVIIAPSPYPPGRELTLGQGTAKGDWHAFDLTGANVPYGRVAEISLSLLHVGFPWYC